METRQWEGQALNYNIVVLLQERDNRTASGLDIGHEADKNEKLEQGIVVSVGNLCPKNDEGIVFINIGDTIVFDKYKATEYTEKGVKYKITLFSDVFKVF